MKINVEMDNQIYEVEIEDIRSRPVVAMVAGERFEVWPAEPQAESPAVSMASDALIMPAPALSEGPLAAASGEAGGSDISAPLPGVIVAVLVKPGDAVIRGQELCTLEAMKMKNAIRSTRDGTVASVAVAVGDQVSHGQVLLSYSD